MVIFLKEGIPVFHIRLNRGIEPQFSEGHRVKILFMEDGRYTVNGVGINGLKDTVGHDTAEKADLVSEVPADRVLRTADNEVRLDAYSPQFVDAVLGGFSLELSGRRYVWHKRDMAVKDILPSYPSRELPDSFKVRKALYVSHCAANFGYDDILVLGNFQYPVLDLIGDMRYDLYRRTVVSSASFPLDHSGIYLSGRTAVFACNGLVDETFIMSEVEVGLSSVPRYEDLSVLERAHRSRIYIDIGVHL